MVASVSSKYGYANTQTLIMAGRVVWRILTVFRQDASCRVITQS
jgi:hypothetical protein